MRAVAMVAVSIVLAGCGGASMEQQRVAKIEASVRASLKDPDSARISVGEVFPFFDGQVACGSVNAKNSFGGYVGDRAFQVAISPSGEVATADISHDERESIVMASACRFMKDYAEKHGLIGKAATTQQQSEFTEDYKKFIFEEARKIPPQ